MHYRVNLKKVLKFFPGKPDKINRIDIKYKRQIDKNFVNSIYSFIKDSLEKTTYAGLTKNVVLGLSGGIDSVTMALLCKNALGKAKVTCIIVDLGLKEHEEQTKFAINVAKTLDLGFKVVKSSKLLRDYRAEMRTSGPFTNTNIMTRIIHNLVFQFADSKLAAVVSTIDKSEILLGRHMEHFYGHFAPLVNLYKTEVYDLAKFLRVPEDVIRREPGCVESWFDKDIFGVSYDYLDPILYLISEKNQSAKNIAQKYDIDGGWLKRVERRVRSQMWRMRTRELKF
jgi:NAD+ synthase